MKQLLDVDVDFYFESNFHGIIEIVDALGGVIIDNPKEFVGQDSSDERGRRRASTGRTATRRWRVPGNGIRTIPEMFSVRALSSRGFRQF